MQRLVLLSPAPPLHVKRVDFAQMLLLPSHSPLLQLLLRLGQLQHWQVHRHAGLMQQHLLPATRELSAATRLPLLPSTAIRIRTPFPCPMEQDRDSSSPRHRVGELPRTATAPCPTHPIPKPQERVMWDGGLILDPARRQRLRQVFPGRPGRREGILEGRGAEQRVGKWSCRWRWPGLWPRLGQGSDGRRMGKGMLLSWAGWLRTRPLYPTHSAAIHIIVI